MNKIVWISSYPKSGNTWLRYLVANYFFNNNQDNDPKIISSIKKFPVDDIMEKISNKNELLKNPYNISKYWIKAQEIMEVKNGDIVFLKNHNALVNINQNQFTNEILSLASIYVVRDPRDVVVSYAYYKNISYEESIKHICSKDLKYIIQKNINNFPSIEILGSWKFNYISWRDGIPNMPKIIIKYEDLLKDCYATFYKVLNFLSKIRPFKINEDQLKFSISASSFKELKNIEKKVGFYENESPNNFFRSGKSNNWSNELTNSQIKYIEKEFNSEMKLLGYL